MSTRLTGAVTARMLQPFRPQPLPIGVDVGSESVKILQLALTPSGPAVAAAVRARIPDGVKGDPDARVVFAGETLRDALRRGGFHGRRVVASLPRELVHYKTHRLPPMPAGELVMAARIDARDLFRFDPDSADVQCLDAGEVRPGGGEPRREVILVAAGKKYIDDFVRALHRAGGRLASLEVEPCALHRSAQRVAAAAAGGATAPDDGASRMLLDIGAVQTRVVIWKGDCVRLVMLVDFGGDHLRAAVSRKLGVPPAEAEQLRRRANSAKPADGVRQVIHDATRHAIESLAREVQASVRYHATTFGDTAPRRIDLLGGAADDPQVRSILSAMLSIPAEPLTLFPGIDAAAIPSADCTPSMGEWAVALGLALKGVPPRHVPAAHAAPAGAPTPTPDAPIDERAEVPAAALTGANS